MSVLSFGSRTRSVFDIARRLRERRWYVQPQLGHGPSPAALHLTVNPSNPPHVEAFLRDLRICAAEAAGPPAAGSAAGPSSEAGGALLAQLSSHPNGVLDSDALTALMRALGSDLIPQGTGATAIHEALDAAPTDVREGLLVDYTNEILF